LTKKKILIFVDWFVPAFKAGGPVRSIYNLVSRFSDDYDFYIVTGDRDLGDEKPFIETEFNEWKDMNSFKVIYLTRDQQKLSKFKSFILEIDPSIIYLNSLFSFTFTLQPLWLKKKFPNIKFILAPRGMLGKGALELKKRKKEVFIGLARLIKLYGGIYWHATNEQEKKEIQQAFGKQDEVIIADNISTNPNIAFTDLKKLKESEFELKRFLFVSRIDRKKNVEKLVHWFIAASSRFENVKLDIIGSVEDQSYYNELLSLIINNENISISGAIHPSKLKEIYAKAHFFCLPTRHENYGHVIIEALSYGCPVIISQRTPWRGLQDLNIGWDLPLDKPEQFISVMEECIEMDKDRYLKMAESAYNFAQEHINREDITQAYRKLLS